MSKGSGFAFSFHRIFLKHGLLYCAITADSEVLVYLAFWGITTMQFMAEYSINVLSF
jgi:hypothetical protein